MNKLRTRRLPLAAALSLALPVLAAEPTEPAETTLAPVVVTAPVTAAPLTVVTDPRAPRQPLPAHDGADLLKSIPGFSVIRKGGTDGDPVLRGMSGSRLGILQDGQEIHGGCGGRMDPPTAYVYPESFDRVTVLKGPQTVLHGAGHSAGVVLFERDTRRLAEPGWSAQGSLTLGRWGRNDQMLDLHGGTPDFQLRAIATRSDSNSYEDGDGREVHSFHTRWSTSAELAWTPDDDSLLALGLGRSDGEAAYADRSMDGTRFERENWSLRFEKRRLAPWLGKVEALLYRSHLDHVMDNFSLRPAPASRAQYALSNPDRTTRGARLAATLELGERLQLVLGADAKDDAHRLRSGLAYREQPRSEDLAFERRGLFGEARYALDAARRVIGGLRIDEHAASDRRAMLMDRASARPASNPSAGRTRRDTLESGFLRYEQDVAQRGTWYVGLGHAQRFPDYWELMRGSPFVGARGESFMSLAPERTTQLDAGTSWAAGDWSGSVSGFYGRVDDHILLRWVNPMTADVRNVDATVYGLEAEAAWRFAPHWTASGTLAWVRGENDSDGRPLAQQPPPEARLGLAYDNRVFSWGALLRLVARQNRVDPGAGNIVANGRDIGPSPGFAVLSLNAGWRASQAWLLTAGVDNLLDRSYSEHLGKGGWDFALGSVTEQRIREPGRTFWVKAQFAFH